MEIAMKIGFVIIAVMIVWRLYPAAKAQLQNGEKGSNQEWMTVALILLAVVAFVAFLIMSVRG
jgi:hypothetical protein